MKPRERIRKAALLALQEGGSPRLARKVLEAPEALPWQDLERRFQALLETVPDDEARWRVARYAWGKEEG